MASVHEDVPLEMQRYLSPPINNTLNVNKLNLRSKELLLGVAEFIKFFDERYKLIISNAKVELAVLSQFLYKNNNRFRNDKCQRFLKMIQKCAARVLDELSLDNEINKFHRFFPIPSDIKNNEKLYLPTRQMLEFVLVRLYGGAILLWKLIVYCQNAGELCLQRIRLGHFWNIGLNNLSCVSRLWTLWISMLVLFEKIYAYLLLVLPLLPVSQAKWLAIDCNYKFPTNICKVILAAEDPCESFLEKFSNITNSGNLPKFVHETLDHKEVKSGLDLGLSVDIGEVIERESTVDEMVIPNKTLTTNFQIQKPMKPKIACLPENAKQSSHETELNVPCSKKKWEKIHEKAAYHTKTPKTLKSFVQEENKLRKTDRKNALTKALEQNQWKEMRGELRHYSDKIEKVEKGNKVEENKLLKKTRNFIICWILFPNCHGSKPGNWSQICAYFSKI